MLASKTACEDSHWTAAFLGVGYARDGEGPDVYHCWSFFRWVQQQRFGRALPPHATPLSLGSIARAMPQWAAESGWQQMAGPGDGDAVFMSTFKRPTHVGVWVADLQSVLHCPEGGAVLHDKTHLAIFGWRLRGFYRPVI